MDKKIKEGIEYEPNEKPLKGGYAPVVIGQDVRENMNRSINDSEEIKHEEFDFPSNNKKLMPSIAGVQPVVVNANQINVDGNGLIQRQSNSNALVDGEDLIANEDEIRDIKYLVACSICQELATLSREPKFCLSCQNAVFCKNCITDWLKQNNSCPMCRQDRPQMQFVNDNKNLMGLIKTVKLYCKYKNRGCPDILPFDQYENHQRDCGECKLCHAEVVAKDKFEHYSDYCPKYMLQCPYCSVEIAREHMFSHRCYQMFCGSKKSGADYYINQSRIANIKEIKTYFDQLKCAVCSNLMRQAKQCNNQKCQSNICQKCLSEQTKNRNECPICKAQNPTYSEVIRQLKNLLEKVRVKCYNCKVDFGYPQIDEHELSCGKCNLCSTKLNEVFKIPDHHINTCPKFKITCIQCQQIFKRTEFKAHKCEYLSPEELNKRLLEKEKAKLQKRQQHLDSGVDTTGQPLDGTDYQNHWRKKTRGCYMLGLGRWFKVCRQNCRKDMDNSTKLFQIIFMMVFSFTEFVVSIFAWDAVLRKRQPVDTYIGLFLAGEIIEYCWHFLSAVIMYSILASQWEGYHGHRFLQVIHVMTMVFVSLFPHGDFLLHMGYRQNGYKAKGIQEPFPDGFKIPKEAQNYQGYISNSYKGGFYTFFALGYQRLVLQLLRVIMWIVGLTVTGDFLLYVRKGHLVLILLIGSGFMSILMLLKIFIENNGIKCCSLKKKRLEYNSLLMNDEAII